MTPRILTIDDEPMYQAMIARALEPLDCQISTAEDGTQGLAMARNLKPDVIITDVVMPDITGYEVTRILRRDPDFAHVPILVLTAQTGLQDKLKAFEVGADDHLTKPFEPAELAARVTALVRRAEIRQATEPAALAKDRGRLIALHSLRGGTGCSSMAVNLSVALASLWKSPTILLDLSMVAGQVALMLNATLKRTWADLSRFKQGELDMQVLSSIVFQHESGLSYIAAPTFPSEAETIDNATLQAAVEILQQRYDYIVADLPHDFSEISVQTLDLADVILMVASPDLASLRGVVAALDTYKKLGYPSQQIKLILNATFPKSGLSREKIESAVKMPITVTVPYTQELFVEAINLGQPLVFDKPEEAVSGLLEDFAFLLSKESHKKTRPQNPSAAWNRVYKRYNSRKK